MMKALGFCENWILLVISCISLVSNSILINSQLGKSFAPSSGLRQRDLLSPYIFIMYVESLSSLINNAERMDEIQVLSVAKGTSINHLLFADDYILFWRASKDEWNRIWDILNTYEKGSGQIINKKKFSIFFSSYTSSSSKQKVI